jgi:hypothetical protein
MTGARQSGHGRRVDDLDLSGVHLDSANLESSRSPARVRIPSDSAHAFRSIPYTRSGVFVHLVKARLPQLA